MEWKTYQILEERAEGEERRRGYQKGPKRAKKRNSKAKIEQNEWQAKQKELE